uniref:Uncharacterized protein n=1 Tax=Steinernema glaseri TaxID=37863 RepID=A0A1I7YXZ7_9BILA
MCGLSLGSLVSIIDLKNITLLTDRIECPHCSLLNCDQYCYIVKHGFRGHSDSQQCADEETLVALIREPLLTNITNDVCQRGRANDDDAVCWCRKSGDRSRKTQEDSLKGIRLWRYKSVLWQRDQIMRMASSAATAPQSPLIIPFGIHFFEKRRQPRCGPSLNGAGFLAFARLYGFFLNMDNDMEADKLPLFSTPLFRFFPPPSRETLRIRQSAGYFTRRIPPEFARKRSHASPLANGQSLFPSIVM